MRYNLEKKSDKEYKLSDKIMPNLKKRIKKLIKMTEAEAEEEARYEAFKEVAEKHDKNLGTIMFSSILLEEKLDTLIRLQLIKREKSEIEGQIKRITIAQKLMLLRFADLIDEQMYQDLRVLNRLRNLYAHESVFSDKFAGVSEELKKLRSSKIKDDVLYDLIDEMPLSPNKFLAFYIPFLFEIDEKIKNFKK